MAKIEEINASTFDCQQLKVFILIDTSGSMCQDGRIQAVNSAMYEVPAQLVAINQSLEDCQLRIAPMTFDTDAKWLIDQPVSVEDFRWRPLKATGITSVGAAFDLLNEKLRITDMGGWLERGVDCAPVIILITDGEPTDDWERALERLKKNHWFRQALKFAVAVGEESSREALTQFTGCEDAVIDTEVLRQDLDTIVRQLVVTSSRAQGERACADMQREVELPYDVDIDPQTREKIIAEVIASITADDDDIF